MEKSMIPYCLNPSACWTRQYVQHHIGYHDDSGYLSVEARYRGRMTWFEVWLGCSGQAPDKLAGRLGLYNWPIGAVGSLVEP